VYHMLETVSWSNFALNTFVHSLSSRFEPVICCFNCLMRAVTCPSGATTVLFLRFLALPSLLRVSSPSSSCSTRWYGDGCYRNGGRNGGLVHLYRPLRMTDGGFGPPIPSATDDGFVFDGWGVSLNPSMSVIRRRIGLLWKVVYYETMKRKLI
jgi:hypothetical protein